ALVAVLCSGDLASGEERYINWVPCHRELSVYSLPHLLAFIHSFSEKQVVGMYTMLSKASSLLYQVANRRVGVLSTCLIIGLPHEGVSSEIISIITVQE